MDELSIIIPCISSVETIPQFIDDLSARLMNNPSDTEVIIVANEKVPSASEVVSYVHKRYPWLKFKMLERAGYTRSYGALVRFGIAYSMSQYVVLLSSYYGENDIAIIPKMLDKVRTGAQVVQATRYSSAEDAKRVPLRFRLYQDIYRLLIRILLGFKISDSTYGFKMFDRVFIQALGLNQNGYSVCPEITLKATLAGGRVEYIASSVESPPINRDFKLYKEGIGYLWLLARALFHRLGVLWF